MNPYQVRGTQAASSSPPVVPSAPPYLVRPYFSKVKKIAVGIIFVFAVQLVMIPAQNLYAEGCVEAATKSVITASIAGLGLLVLDCFFFGCLVTATTVGVGGAALGPAALKGAAVAGAYGCVNASLWDKPSPPSPQPSR